jgi:hypothetical protein
MNPAGVVLLIAPGATRGIKGIQQQCKPEGLEIKMIKLL